MAVGAAVLAVKTTDGCSQGGSRGGGQGGQGRGRPQIRKDVGHSGNAGHGHSNSPTHKRNCIDKNL